MRLGLFGGSFNPVHLGHLLVARAALEELDLTRLFFIPAAQSPFKPGMELAPPGQRIRLLRLALAGETWCEVDDQEIGRGGVSFTIETVRHFSRTYPDARLFYLIGTDHVSLLPKWKDAEELATLADFVVIPRPGEKPLPLPKPFKGKALTGFPFQLSSSQVRARVRQGLSINLLVTPPVAEAIYNNRLYL